MGMAAVAPGMAFAEEKKGLGSQGEMGGGRYNVKLVDDPELAVQMIKEQSAANEAANKRRRELDSRTQEEKDADEAEKAKPIQYAVGGGLALSVPFFAANLQRLGTKV